MRKTVTDRPASHHCLLNDLHSCLTQRESCERADDGEGIWTVMCVHGSVGLLQYFGGLSNTFGVRIPISSSFDRVE